MSNSLALSALPMPPASSATMRGILDDRARLQRLLDVEAAVARAEAAVGVIPASAAAAITQAARAERYDLAKFGEAVLSAGDILAPLISALTEEVAKIDADAARYVHWSAAGQDIIDTALVLELRAVIDALIEDISRAVEALALLTGRYRRTLAVARTGLQHALPMPFGLKLVGYAAALARSRDRLRRLRKDALALQFGGAAGTLAALGERGLDVSERLAALLNLSLPDAPWHGHSDRLAEVASGLAILAGTCGKIARDLALLMQTDVGEVSATSPPGRGQASTMPHIRDPHATATAISAAMMAPNLTATILAAQAQEHERGLGTWQTHWSTFPALALVTSNALTCIFELVQGLEVDGDRMRANLETTRGLIMAEAVSVALAAQLGKLAADKLVAEASRKAIAEKRSLQNVLSGDERVAAHIDAARLGRLLDPLGYQGVAQTFIDRVIASLRVTGHKR
jgi:3-carboxy-cis,cis-muconate cycloisomerase